MVIEIYADGADLDAIRKLSKDIRVCGYTTNPSLLRKAGVSNYQAFAEQVLEAVEGKPVSFEVFSDDLAIMKDEAREISSWGPNVFVKIPITNSRGVSTAPVLATLSSEGVLVNVTAVMTLQQAHLAMANFRKPGNIVSIFAGRIADTGVDPEPIVKSAAGLRGTKVLWASAREVFNVCQAERCGADIITLSPELIGKLGGFGKDLNVFSLETVRQFKKDAEGISL